ncbi:MAG: class I SAM-dependent methyltransferase [Eubacterium sp.]|nr:class I SAM-dependent methyltransferase [Eubacterium sp.]
MENGTRQNAKAWTEVYKTTSFGNNYPTDCLVSLYHHFIKQELAQKKHPVKVLDFGCSHGANAKFFLDQGFDVYGIDISKDAVDYCIRQQRFDKHRFAACDLLGDHVSIQELFGTFDLVIASECLYYFSQSDFDALLQNFYECMNEHAVIYANMHTWNHPLYKNYRDMGRNAEGLTQIPASGKADLPLHVRIVENKQEMRQLFRRFQETATVRSVLELESEMETLHYIGKKIR